MMTAKLVIKEQATGNETQLSGTFSDEQTEILKAYYRYVEELSEVKVLKDGFPAKVQLQYEAGKGMAYSTQLPPDNDVWAFLHKIRPLVLNDEHASYNRTTGIIAKAFPHPNIRLLIKAARKVYDGRSFQQQIKIKTAGMVINSDEVLRHWWNATEYHRAQDEPKKVMNALDAVLPPKVSRAVFLMLLSDQALAVFDVITVHVKLTRL